MNLRSVVCIPAPAPPHPPRPPSPAVRWYRGGATAAAAALGTQSVIRVKVNTDRNRLPRQSHLAAAALYLASVYSIQKLGVRRENRGTSTAVKWRGFSCAATVVHVILNVLCVSVFVTYKLTCQGLSMFKSVDSHLSHLTSHLTASLLAATCEFSLDTQ